MAELVDPEKLISVAQVAHEYGYNARYLSRAASEGKFKSWYVASTWVTTRELLEEYIRTAPPAGRRPHQKIPKTRKR